MIWQMRVVILAAWVAIAAALAGLGYVAATAHLAWLLWAALIAGSLGAFGALASFMLVMREIYGPHLWRQIFGLQKSGVDDEA